MNLYEITYLITPDLTEDEAISFNDKLVESIKQKGATLHKAENPKKRFLAYKINKQFDEAYLGCIGLEAEVENIKDIESNLKNENQILRYILVSKEEIEAEETFTDFSKEIEEELEAKEIPTKEVEEEKDIIVEEEKKELDTEEEVKEEPKKEEEKEKKIKLKEIDEKIDEIL